MVTKRIKNNTESSLIFFGETIQPQEYFTINPNYWLTLVENNPRLISMISSGDVIVNDGSSDLNISDGIEYIKRFQPDPDVNYLVNQIYIWQIHKTKNGNNLMSNATWFDSWPSSNPSGSYSGYSSSAQPLIIPFNCHLKKALITFRKANFDWRSSVGSIFMELGFYTMIYNGHTDYCRLGLELSGDYSGNNTDYDTHKFEIINFVERVGSNNFSKHDLLGVQLRKDISREGQIQSLSDPMILLYFEEIK